MWSQVRISAFAPKRADAAEIYGSPEDYDDVLANPWPATVNQEGFGTMSIIAGLAPAKVNLSLRVVSRRPDGFHDIDSVVAFLDLCDSLMFSYAPPGVQELHMTGRTGAIPADHSNLVLRAAEALADDAGADLPFSASLDKRIPAGSGLGGGSSDAATTLQVLAELHSLDLDLEQIARIGAAVGSDVPMFLAGGYGACRITGRGEVVQRLGWAPRGFCLLLLPGIHVPTPAVYAAWDQQPLSSPADRSERSSRGADGATRWLDYCFNDLQAPALRLFPRLQAIRDQAQNLCGRPVLMTGSGSAMFTAFEDAAQAERMAHRISTEVDVETLVVPFRTRAGNKLPEVQHADH